MKKRICLGLLVLIGALVMFTGCNPNPEEAVQGTWYMYEEITDDIKLPISKMVLKDGKVEVFIPDAEYDVNMVLYMLAVSVDPTTKLPAATWESASKGTYTVDGNTVSITVEGRTAEFTLSKDGKTLSITEGGDEAVYTKS